MLKKVPRPALIIGFLGTLAQRDLLLPKLISGEIDVSEIGEPIVEAAE